jgi:hypothetical protein
LGRACSAPIDRRRRAFATAAYPFCWLWRADAGRPLAITALPTFIVVYGGMLPTVVVFLVDARPGRYLFRTVGVSNAAGVIPFLSGSLNYGSNAGVIVSPVGSFDTWLTIYGAAGAGWFMVLGVPMLWQIFFEMVLIMKMRRYQTAREALIKEWDLEQPGE